MSHKKEAKRWAHLRGGREGVLLGRGGEGILIGRGGEGVRALIGGGGKRIVLRRRDKAKVAGLAEGLLLLAEEGLKREKETQR